MDTKRIRQKLLDLAIRGELVPQDPADEPASELLARIHEEKLAMVERGELKPKDVKGDSVIYIGDDGLYYEQDEDDLPICIEEQIPFSIPANWSWARIKSLANEPKYGTSQKSDSDGKIPVLRMGNITRVGTIRYEDLAYTSDDSDIEKYQLCPGDVIFNRTNSKEWVGKTAYYDGSIPAIYAGYLVAFRPVIIMGKYINYAMCSQYERDWCMTVKTDGVNQSNINVQKLKAFLLPVPPLEEQKRIVAALDEYLGLVDDLERNESELDGLVKKAKSKVLDLAIRGKLVPQDPADEPASELLARIHEEKLAMVDRGELKPKDVKGDSVIYLGDDGKHYEKLGSKPAVCIEEEIPFALPRNWAWVRLGAVNTYISKTVDPSMNLDKTYELYSVPTMPSGYPEMLKGMEIGSTKPRVDRGDVLLCKINPRINRVWHVTGHSDAEWIASSEWIVIRQQELSTEYLEFAFQSPYFRELMLSNVSGVGGSLQRAQPAAVAKYLIPIPPLDEQKRIVRKLDLLIEALESVGA